MTTDTDETDAFIAAAMKRVAASAVPPHPVRFAPSRTPRRSAPLALAVAAAAAVVAVVGVGAWFGLTGRQQPGAEPATGPTTSGSPAAACGTDYPARILPRWARTGFDPPTQAVPYVLGDRGDMAAIVWSTRSPLTAPPANGPGDKVLWVARVGPGDGPLRIRATLAGTNRTVRRTVSPAPGPSSFGLPAAGCWSLDLAWGTHRDHLVLGVAPG